MNSVTELWANWDKLHTILRKPHNNFHPACDTCTHAACCDEPVFSDSVEVDHILDTLSEEQKVELRDALFLWHERFTSAGMLSKSEKGLAFPYRDAVIPCPFLKNGRCSIYEQRPIACRTHYALANPDDCKLTGRATQKYAIWDKSEPYQNILLQYVITNGIIRIDHFALMLWNRMFNQTELSAAASQYEIEKVEK